MSFYGNNSLISRQKAYTNTPNTISGLSLWLDANVGVLNSSSTAATNNNAVATWQDQSGSNRNLTQSVATRRPLLLTNQKNNKSVLRFDGVDDVLFSTTAGFMYNSGSVTILTVVKGNPSFNRELISERSSTTISEYIILQSKPYGSNNPSPILNSWIRVNSTLLLQRTTSGTNRDYGTAFDNIWRMVGAIDTGNSYTAYIDGVGSQTVNYDISRVNASAVNFQYLHVGAGNSAGSLAFAGDIGEIIVYNRVLTVSERIGVQNYLKNKWAI